jgi:hypothetical protein
MTRTDDPVEAKVTFCVQAVISPLLANLFLHYAFDTWMKREHLDIPFERYADDVICHCGTEQQPWNCRRNLRNASANTDWHCIRRRRRSSTAGTATGQRSIRTRNLIFSATDFVRGASRARKVTSLSASVRPSVATRRVRYARRSENGDSISGQTSRLKTSLVGSIRCCEDGLSISGLFIVPLCTSPLCAHSRNM